MVGATVPRLIVVDGFALRIERVTTLPSIPGVVIAGPVLSGTCHAGDALEISARGIRFVGRCLQLPFVNWRVPAPEWVTLAVGGVGKSDLVVGGVVRGVGVQS